ncbi:MAG TPA: amino acid adenylation domain-containing protein [Egibacteraceae bacterium]|nr:amino acid adenylation domain-containing protein [Egibacteraceae bacterium]
MTTLRGPTMPLPEDATLATLVEAQVDRTPGAVALVGGDEQVTYAALDDRANRLAHHLRARGVGPDVPVAVCVERSVHLAVALLGVLKSGGACLPLDPAYPAARLAFMLADAAPPVVLTVDRLTGALPAYPGPVVRLDADWSEVARNPADRPDAAADPDHLAYVMYTSGSTGQPKGVMLAHRGLVNHSLAVRELYGLRPDDRVVQFCSISFDVSVEEIFPTWASGGAVVLRPDDVPVLGRAWVEWLRRLRATVLNLPTAYWHEWVRDLATHDERVPGDVRLVVVGGERALGSAYRSWLEVGGDVVPWVNAYGPAETSVLATAYQPPVGARLPDGVDPPIGRPLANTTLHILDARGEAVSAGTPGDLHIGGVGVARGYLNSPDLTAERFVPDPFSTAPEARLYRTGDLVQVLPDGNLAFVGRVDEQVKVRGFRIECREVESVLTRHPAVTEAVVVAREDSPGDRRLVAYVVGGQEPAEPGGLRRFLAERLPSYMVPGAFVHLDGLPLSPNGKVAREALPPPGDARAELPTRWVAPRTPTEEAIVAIWSRVLGVTDVGVDDDFFDLGGHSLQATHVVAQVRERFGVAVGVRALLDAPTVAELAAAVDAERGHDPKAPPLRPQPLRPGQRIPLTLSQEQMWRLETTADPPGLFNVTALHRFSGRVDEAVLRGALGHLAQRHDALRTSFHVDDGEPHQTVAREVPAVLDVTDLTTTDPAEQEDALRRRVAAQDAAPFDLAAPPLWRACLYRLDDERCVLAATFDHLVCDGTSAYVFLSELSAAYDALAAGRTPALRRLAVSYADYALWQRQWLAEERLQAQVDYWKRKLAGMPLGPAVPFDRVPEQPSRRIVARPMSVAPEMYERLQRLARRTRSTVFVTTAAVVQALCSRVGGATDVVFSTTLSGRQHAELDGLVGCFHGVGRIRTDLSGDPPFAEVVARVRESVLGLFEHQDVPFWRVRQAVLPHFPSSGAALLAAAPTEFQYFHTAHDEWAPGTGVVERPGPDKGPDELYFRGQLHPLAITFLDDGTQLWGELRYKSDFYDADTIERLAVGLDTLLGAVTEDVSLRLSELVVDPRQSARP